MSQAIIKSGKRPVRRSNLPGAPSVLPSGEKRAIKKVVRDMLSSTDETKYFDVTLTQQTIDYNGRIDHLSAVPQGDSDSQRDGDVILPKRLDIMIRIDEPSGVTLQSNLTRCLVFRYKPTITTTPGNIITLGTVLAPLSPFQWDYLVNFDVLYDEVFVTGDYGGTPISHVKKISLNLKRNKIQYVAGSTGTAAGKLFLMFVTDQVTSGLPIVTYYSRLQYLDQ
jgi:hypothetical protein